jgi:hypothetical protein
MTKKKSERLLGIVILLIFITIVFFNEIRTNKIDQGIKKNRIALVGQTKGCDKNVRSSMYTLKYIFAYQNKIYSGKIDFDKSKRGDICSGSFFLIEFDSLHPENNRLILDSAR